MDAPCGLLRTVDDNASREEIAPGVPLPSSLTAVAKQLAAWRFGVEWQALDYLADMAPYERLPFLVFHGVADETVPVATSREFKSLLPDQVQLEECEGADHIECWNWIRGLRRPRSTRSCRRRWCEPGGKPGLRRGGGEPFGAGAS